LACSPAGEGTTHAHADLAGAARRPFTLAGHVILDSGVTFLTYTAAKETQQ
jgi:hypothetical protein